MGHGLYRTRERTRHQARRKVSCRTSSHESLEGEGAALRIIIEWSSKEAAQAFMSDPSYVPHLKARTAGSNSHHFLIEGKDDLS